MLDSIKSWVVTMLISGVWKYVLSNAPQLLLTFALGILAALVTLAKKGVSFLPAKEEAVADEAVDDIKDLITAAVKVAVAQIAAKVTSALSDGKLTTDEAKSIFTSTLNTIVSSFNADMTAKLVAEFGTIENAIENYIKDEVLEKFEELLDKIGIHWDLDGSDSTTTTSTTEAAASSQD